MGILDDILSGGKSALEGAGNFINDNTALGSHTAKATRAAEISDFAFQQGYRLGAADPGFRRDYPDLAAENDEITSAMVMATGGGGAIASARGAGARAINPPRATPEEIIRSRPGDPPPGLGGPGPIIDGTVVPPRGTGAINPPRATPEEIIRSRPGDPPPGLGGPGPIIDGTVVPPRGAAAGGSPAMLPPGGGMPPPPGGGMPPPPGGGMPPPPGGGIPYPQPPGGGYVPSTAATPPRGGTGVAVPTGAAAPPAPAATGRPGLLTTIGSLPRGAQIAAGVGALGAGIAAGVGLGAAQGSGTTPPGRTYGPTLEESDANAAAIAAAEDKRRAEDRRQRDIRADEANISLTEAQAAHYRAERDRALRALANDDLSESEKAALAHEFAMEEVAARAAADRDNTMIREGGETERTTIREAGEDRRTGVREAGEDRRTGYRGEVEMRGQDQRAREAQDTFVTNWIQNQILNGQLSLSRAEKLFEAYQKQQKLPSEILETVSRAVTPMLPYMRGNSTGEQMPGYERGGAANALASAAGRKYTPPQRQQNTFNLQEVARTYGAIPPDPNQPIPTAAEIFEGAGQGADMSPEGVASIRGASASSTALPRPAIPDPSTYSAPMPGDVQQRIIGSIR